MALTDIQLRNSDRRRRGKLYKLYDEESLYVEVAPPTTGAIKKKVSIYVLSVYTSELVRIKPIKKYLEQAGEEFNRELKLKKDNIFSS